MSEPKKEVSFVETTNLFSEMVKEKYFSGDCKDNMIILVSGSAEQSLVSGLVCGNRSYLSQALYELCKDDNGLTTIVMDVAYKIAAKRISKVMMDDLFHNNGGAIENDDD